MKSITLSTKQISKLIQNKYIEIENDILELETDNLVLNCNGNISYISSYNLNFKEREIENKHVIDFLQNLICEHLNLSHTQVIYLQKNGEEIEFKIKLVPNKESQIVVCNAREAAKNVKYCNDEPIDIKINAPYIGIYKQLGKSFYYFRWFDEI